MEYSQKYAIHAKTNIPKMEDKYINDMIVQFIANFSDSAKANREIEYRLRHIQDLTPNFWYYMKI